MKTVIFIRHAKSSWTDYNLSDHERPLNDRGKRDAPIMAAHLVSRVPKIDGILTSDAKRARKTARVFAEAYGIGKKTLLEDHDLYHAIPSTIERAVQSLPESWSTVLVFGHNPGFTDVANRMVIGDYIDNVPTCGIVGSESTAIKWPEWKLKEARRTFFTYPKDL